MSGRWAELAQRPRVDRPNTGRSNVPAMSTHPHAAISTPRRRRQPREPHPSALAYGVDEAARVLGISRRSLYELITERRLGSVKLCGRRLIPRASLERLLAELEEEDG